MILNALLLTSSLLKIYLEPYLTTYSNLILSQKSHSVSSDNVVGDQEAECSCCKNGHDDQELIHLRLLETNDLKFIDD